MRKFLTITAAVLLLCSCSLLKYENSEESPIGGYKIPAEFTEEEREIQGLLQSAAAQITSMFAASKSVFPGYPEYKVIFNQSGDKDGEHAEKVYRMSFSHFPATLAEHKKELRDYLTNEALKMFEENFAVGEEKTDVQNQPNGVITVTVTEGRMLGADGSLTDLPYLIRLDSNITLCSEELFKTAEDLNSSFWATAHITEKTDDEIKFAYIVDTDGVLSERTGVIKNEDGWKLSWYMDWLE